MRNSVSRVAQNVNLLGASLFYSDITSGGTSGKQGLTSGVTFSWNLLTREKRLQRVTRVVFCKAGHWAQFSIG